MEERYEKLTYRFIFISHTWWQMQWAKANLICSNTHAVSHDTAGCGFPQELVCFLRYIIWNFHRLNSNSRTFKPRFPGNFTITYRTFAHATRFIGAFVVKSSNGFFYLWCELFCKLFPISQQEQEFKPNKKWCQHQRLEKTGKEGRLSPLQYYMARVNLHEPGQDMRHSCPCPTPVHISPSCIAQDPSWKSNKQAPTDSARPSNTM